MTIQEINAKKSEIQSAGYEKWKNNWGKGVFEWATGVGKTRLATHHAIPQLQHRHPGSKAIVVVPSIVLQDDWIGKDGHIEKYNLKNVEVWVVNTYVKSRHICDLLVLDEIHRYSNEDTKMFRKVLEQTQYKWVLGLSATINPEQRSFLESKRIPVLDTISTFRAEQMGLIAPYKVFNLGVELTEEDREQERYLHDNFVKYHSYFDNDFDTAMACLTSTNPRWDGSNWYEPFPVEYAREKGWRGLFLNEAVENYMRKKNLPHGQKGTISIWGDEHDDHPYTPTNISICARQFVKYMNARQDYLHNAIGKLEATLELIRRTDVQTIIFSERTSFAESITESLGDICRSYHSDIPKAPIIQDGNPILYKSGKSKGKIKLFGSKVLKRYYKELFEKEKIRVLSTAKALDEGVDINGIELAVITSASSTKRQNVQRIGRSLRAKEGKTAVIVNVYVKGSQDEKWLKSRQAGDMKRPIWVDSVDEILNYDGKIKVKSEDSTGFSTETGYF